MVEKNKNIKDHGKKLLSWKFPEFEQLINYSDKNREKP